MAQIDCKMKARRICLALFLLLSACASGNNIDPITAQATAQSAWNRGRHGTWELTWREAPLPGSIIFEAWQTEAGQQQRLEILEAGVPSLVGLVYINDGQRAAYFNRLEPTVPPVIAEPRLPFSPISDAFEQVTNLLVEPPLSARQATIDLPQGRGLQLVLSYPQTQTLTLWLDAGNNLPLQAKIESPTTHLTLIARTLEPLSSPHPDLFKRF